MIVNFQFYLGQYVIWPFILGFICYVIGKPRFLVRSMNKIIDFKLISNHQFYKVLIFMSSFGIVSNLYDRHYKLAELQKASLATNVNDVKFNSAKKTIFLCERGIFLYFLYLIFTLTFMKFSDVYSKKFELEDKLAKLKANIDNQAGLSNENNETKKIK